MSKLTWLLILAFSCAIVYLEIAAVTGTWRVFAKPAGVETLTEGKVYVLKTVATVEIMEADGLSNKCLLDQGDRIKILQIVHSGTHEHAVTVSYELASPIRPFDDYRCDNGMVVTLTEMTVAQLTGMRESDL